MSYQKLLEQVAREHNTTPQEVDSEMRTALQTAGYDIEPAMFIALATAKAKRLYIVISIICSLYYSYKISIIILLGVILMTIVEATKLRIEELCNERGLNFCRLATISAVPYTTVKSIVYNQSKNPSITTIKKICDGLDITITDFFDTETFRNLEQGIKWFKPTFESAFFYLII